MSSIIACIAGAEIQRQFESGHLKGRRLGKRQTPFGPSGEIFMVEDGAGPYYLLMRHEGGLNKPAPCKVNNRANIYAVKDLGVQCVLAWGPGGAVTHNFAVGDLVILSDLIDVTFLRDKTFFEDSPLGFLRQFPVFCPSMRRAMGEVLHQMKLVYHGAGVAAVCEGPRLETPAEVRMLAAGGAELVTHSFVPEAFLARELQLCYAPLCYVVNYAETGSRHRPFSAGDLFGGLTEKSQTERIGAAIGAISTITRNLAAAVNASEKICECDKVQAANIRQYDLPDDWHKWFK